jgi:DNA-directed RNA polymerase
MSNLPVHQDGSCNGLQHYAALGRDLHGGEAVNLVPADRGADVYTGIANVLKRIVAEDIKLIDSEDEEDVNNAKLAMALAQHIDRKLVKQTVMTSVYGVTFIGARAQIYSRLREREAMEDNELLRYRVSNYAAKRTLDALNNMFSNARDVMGWLTTCATIATSAGEPVRWTTPLGLPVVQPYHSQRTKRVRTILQSFSLKVHDEQQPVMKVKQRIAFPPNYIHSIDSSHMMRTAIACVDAGLTFAGVHDSFWTHATDVDTMNVILREKFIEVHKEPLLENLYHEFRANYPDVADEFPQPPAPGDLDLDVVRDSVYFFS